ncbi:MAG TPA: ATP synthase F0 subunit B [Geobacteraceae bacterium]|nr:ATP synthase F0 subunit B [Geobacteraceae bacterium]
MNRTLQRNGWIKPVFTASAIFLLLAGLAATGFASEGGEGSHAALQMKDFGWRILNFAMLAAILIWGMKKANVSKLLADRQAGIEKALKEAVQAREAAEKKYAEYSEKLTQATKEIDEIYASIKKEGELEKERIIAEAKVSAEKIREQAEQTAAREVLKARTELQAEAARLAVQLAEQALRENVGKDDQNRLVGEYLTKVVELH